MRYAAPVSGSSRQATIGAAIVALICAGEALTRRGGSPALGLVLAALLGGAVGFVVTALAHGVRRWTMAAALLLSPPVILGFGALDYAVARASRLSTAAGLGSLWGVALAGATTVAWLAVRARPLRVSRRTRAALAIAVGAAVIAGLLEALYPHRELLARVFPHVALAGGLALLLWIPRLRRPLSPALALLALGVLHALPARYHELRALSGWLFVAATALAIRTWSEARVDPAATTPSPAPARWRLLAWAVGPAAMLLGAHALVTHVPGAFQAAHGSGLMDVLVWTGRAASDFDGDGFGAAFGHRDCAAWDPAVNPGAHEIPGDDADENCLRGPLARRDPAFLRAREALRGPPSPWRGDVVMVLADALRFDEFKDASLPNLRALEAGGRAFERAYSTSSFTSLVMLGLFAARLPGSVPLEFWSRLNAIPTTPYGGLVAHLARLGYDTGLVHMIVNPSFVARTLGADLRLKRFPPRDATPADVVAAARDVWTRLDAGKPRFLYVHVTWTHVLHYTRDAYRDDVRKVDAFVGALRSAVGHDALWIFTADHGEELMDHGGRFHAATLYEEVVRVPLVVAGPPIAPGRVTAVTTLREVTPTLVAMLDPGAAPPGPGPYLCLGDGACPDVPAPMALELRDRHLHGLVLGHRKIIRDLARDAVEAFDLRADPAERRPLDPVPDDLLRALEDYDEHAFGAEDPCFYWPYCHAPAAAP